MSSTDNEDDPSFVTLPARLRHRIDRAFDSVASSVTQSRLEAHPGGFIVGESESGPSQYEAGGFLVGDYSASSFGSLSHIPLSEIPRALNFLDLFPDDDIMGVFQNAATGWGAQSVRNDGVSRKDWRAVCAALLEGEPDEDIEMGVDSGPSSDEYQMKEELSGDTEEASSDEYEAPSTAARVKKAQKIPQKIPAKSPAEAEVSGQLTESQKAQCRQEFRRFFPHVSDDELDHQRITIKDIIRAADLLKENLKTEEILEMLEAFSTSPDKTMNLADFEHMMILTKLV